MTTSALKNQAFPTTRPQATQKSPTLRAESARLDVLASEPLTGEAQLEKQARNLIGTTFFAQMLKQMRDSPFKSELFSGGRGGQAFTEMFDSHLAQRMAQRSGGKLTRPIVKKYKQLANDAYAKQKKSAADTTHATEAQHVPHDSRA